MYSFIVFTRSSGCIVSDNETFLQPRRTFVLAANRQSNLQIRVGRDNTSFTNNDKCHHLEDALPEGASTEILCDSVVKGRYVWIQRTGEAVENSYYNVSLAPLSLCEIHVLASQGK